MAATESSDRDQIYGLTKECQNSFQLILSTTDPGPCRDFVSTQHKSFRAWIATIGALAPLQASLDHRLREHRHIKLAVVELLLLVKDCLDTEPCQTESGSEKNEGDKSKAEKPQVLIGQHTALEKALECIHQLASSIRRSSVPNSKFDLSARFSKGGKVYDPNFENFAKLLVKYRFPSASESLCEQLGTAMSRRRNWLLYNYRHAQKLSQDYERGPLSITNQPTSTRDAAGPSSAAPLPSSQQNQFRRAMLQERIPLPAYSDTVGSRLSVSNKLTNWQAPSSVSSKRTGMSQRNDMRDYPPIPKFDQGDKFSLCPYCFKSLHTEKLTMSYWRKHYDDDTRPFVCLSEECDEPPQFFSRLDTWEKHMVEQHSKDWAQTVHSTVWFCDIDECRADEKIFYLRREFEEHMRSKPKRKYSATQISALMVRKQREALRDAMKCPLCEVKVDTKSERIPSLAAHVGDHLHYLTGLCVPQMDASAEEANSESQSAGKRTERDSHTDSKAELLTEAEKDKPLFQDEDRVPEAGESAAKTYYMSPKWASPSRTVDGLYFMTQDYDPLQDTVLQYIAKHKRLCNRLMSALLTCKINNEEFLPENCLRELVNVSSIQAELEAELRHPLWIFNSQLKLAGRIYEKASKVFAILAMISQVKVMKDLDQEGLTDENLPLYLKEPDILVSRSSGKEFKAFARYAGSDRLFEKMQWRVLAPMLDMSGKHITLDRKCALPIIVVEDVPAKDGGSSLIFKGILHRAHFEGLETTDKWDRQVAIKEFRHSEAYSARENFEKEKYILDEIHKLGQHPHLIRAIFSCQIGDKYYILFPWADGGSLTEFWKCQDSRLGDPDLLLWSLQQLLGIADALKALHSTNFRHGDLKPDKILHFKRGNPFCKGSEDVLVISCFGVSRMHRQTTSLRLGGTNTRSTPSYEAPEVDGEQTVPRSRRYDMWSMGCIILEFVVWLLYGHDAIKRFSKARVHNSKVINPDASFYESRWEEENSPNFEINPAVIDVIKALRDDPRCKGSTAIGDLVALIPMHLLQLEPQKRATAEYWWKELGRLVSMAEGDESYLIRRVDPSPAIPDVFVLKGEKRNAKKLPNHDA